MGMTQKEIDAILKSPKGRSYNELKIAVEQGRAALANMRTTTEQEKKEFDALAKSVKEADIQMKQLAGSSKATATSFEKAWSRLKTYIGLYVGAAVAMQKIVATMGDLMELSDKMGEVRKTTGFTADEVGRLSASLAKMDTRTTLTGLMELSAVAGQLGLKTEQDVRGFTEAANMLMVALPEMGKEGATAMLKVALATGEIDRIREQMQKGLIEGSDAVSVAMTKIGSTIDSLRANSAAAAPAITDFVKRVGAVGAQSGITIDQVAALGSTVDALGMRVEMSATALSRMIPAIKNNAFEISKAIGVTPETIRGLFDAGRGMEAILMILQHMKDSGADEDGIERMLGMGGMADIMKDLNQQGARAGIVFAGLSQNVDELRRQLGVAKNAYEENIAIQNEYNKMNETTAAKWERLKNEFEEMFVTDTVQRWLGHIIDGLRWIVDFISGNVNPALQVLSTILKGILTSWAVFKIGLGEGIFIKAAQGLKSMGQSILLLGLYTKDYIALKWQLIRAHKEEEKAAIRAALAQKGLNKEVMANIWMAIAAAIIYFTVKIYDAISAVSELDQELARMDAETQAAEKHLNNLVEQFNAAATKSENAAKKHKELEEKTKALREEVEKLKSANDDSAEASENLQKKEEELRDAEQQLKQATSESNQANDERLKLIAEINTKYSTYLGYMLSEKTAAEQVASAHQLIVAALKEELKQKGLSRKQEALDKKYEEDIKEYSEDALDELSALPREVQQRIRDAWNTVQASITSNINNQGQQTFGLSKIKGIANSGETFSTESELLNYLKDTLKEIVEREVPTQEYKGSTHVKLGKNLVGLQSYIDNLWGGSMDDGFGDWAETIIKKEAELEQVRHDSQVESNAAHAVTIQAAVDDISSNMAAINKATKENKEFTDDQIRQLAQNVNAVVADVQKYRNDLSDVDKLYGKGKEETLENAVNTLLSTVDEKVRKQVLNVAKQASKKSVDEVNPNPTNPWGSSQPAESTAYENMTAEALVTRRKQMKDFVNTIQTDTDVQSVLKEDAALKKAIEKGMSSDMRTVIEWYNTERLKIQEELHARHLTNTGDWKDPKNDGASKQKKAEQAAKEEMKAALAALDAYYNERDAKIKEAQNTGEITEAESKRRALKNDLEHYKRREELRKMFLRETENISQEEQDAIYQIIDTEDDGIDMVKKQFANTVKFIDTLSKYGSSLRDGIRKNMTQDLQLQQTTLTKYQKNIDTILKKGFDSADKAYEQFKETLDALGILLSPDGTLGNELKDFLLRAKSLAQSVREAYTYSSGDDMAEKMMTQAKANIEQMRRLQEAAYQEGNNAEAQTLEVRMKSEQAYYDWLAATDKQTRDKLLVQLQDYNDNYEEAINKMAKQEAKRAERMFSKSAEGRDFERSRMSAVARAKMELGMGDELSNARGSTKPSGTTVYKGGSHTTTEGLYSVNSKGKRKKVGTRKTTEYDADNRQGNYGTIANSGVFGNYNDVQDEIAVIDLQIERQQALMKSTYELLEAEKARSEAKVKQAELDVENAKSEEERVAAMNALSQAEQEYNAQVAVNQQVIEEQQMRLDELWTNRMVKLESLNSVLAQGLEGYITALDAYAERAGELIGEGAFGDPEKRKEAARELLKDVIKTTGSLLKQWLVYLTTRKFMDEAEVKMNEAKNIRLLAADAALTGSMLSIHGTEMTAAMAMNEAEAISKEAAKKGLLGLAVGAAISIALSALMSMAMSKLSKAQSEVASAAGTSAYAGKLATGMLTYAEGNVNEFTDPGSLQEGRSYNVDAADGRTYRARYMGRNPKTHITSGPEFHLAGERGQEMIIDAGTTRQIVFNEPAVLRAIQTLRNGGQLSSFGGARRGGNRRGMATFAGGNVDGFEEAMENGEMAMGDNGGVNLAALKSSLDRNSEVLERALREGFRGVFDVYGKGGLIDSYDSGKKIVSRYGQKF